MLMFFFVCLFVCLVCVSAFERSRSFFIPVACAHITRPYRCRCITYPRRRYVLKRPYVDEFLTSLSEHFEIIVYTASLNKYADPLLDLLDPKGLIAHRLFRESCVNWCGNYVKDLSLLNRDLKETVFVDNSPTSYMFNVENSIGCTSFIDDKTDVELEIIKSFLIDFDGKKGDYRNVNQMWKKWQQEWSKGVL